MNIGIIGIGKITSAIVEGLNTPWAGHEIFLSPRNEEKSTALAAKFEHVHRLDSNEAVLQHADYIIIGLRPAVALDILRTLPFKPHHIVISLVPLVLYDDIKNAVHPAYNICRAIPLPTVVAHNCPIPIFRASEEVTALFRTLGQPLPVTDEAQLHAIWTLTGLITPFYDLLQTLSAWTIAHGVDAATANQYVADLFQSLSYMAQHTDPIDFNALGAHAATPNGMNEQAGKQITAAGAHQAWQDASDKLLDRFPRTVH